MSGVDANPARYVANRASALTDSRGLAPDDEIAAMDAAMQMEDVYWNTVYEFWSVSNAIVSKQMEIKSLKGAFQIYMKQAKVDASTRLKIDAEMKNYESAFDYQALLSVETSMQKLIDAISKTQKQAKENMQTAQKKITQAYNVNIQLRKKQLELYDQMVALEWYMNKSAK